LSLEAGAELQVTRARRPSYNFEGGRFYQMSLPMSDYLGRLRLSGTEYALLYVLTGKQNRGGLITMTQKMLAERLRTGRTDVSRILKKFRRWGLVIQIGNGAYRINPRVAFYGTSEEQEAVLSELDEDLPTLNLPKIPEDG
jgi:CRP-like cAMP-binding protein